MGRHHTRIARGLARTEVDPLGEVEVVRVEIDTGRRREPLTGTRIDFQLARIDRRGGCRRSGDLGVAAEVRIGEHQFTATLTEAIADEGARRTW